MIEGLWMLDGRVVKLRPLSVELGVNYNTFRKWVWQMNLKKAVERARMDKHELESLRYSRWLNAQPRCGDKPDNHGILSGDNIGVDDE